MFFKKKITVAGTLVALVVLGIAASAPADPTYKNLKVLPKNITHEQLDSVMHQFNRSLNVKCNFCHASQKDNPRKLDFASDEKGEKNVTRDMMRMTDRINKKFFKFKKEEGKIAPVGCMTCHNGNPHPEAKAPNEEKKGPPPPPPAAPQNPAN
jgi:hypothetical protein